MEEETKEQIISEAFGEVSALFMSQKIIGTKIVMPSEDLNRIAIDTINRLEEL